MQRSSGDLQDFPQQDDQTVRVSQSGRGNVCLSCCFSTEETGRQRMICLERISMVTCPLPINISPMLFCRFSPVPPKNLTFKSSLTCWDLLQTSATLWIWFTVDISEPKTDRRSASRGFFSLMFQVFFFLPLDFLLFLSFSCPDLGRGLLQDSD